MAAVIFSGSDVKTLKSNIDLFGNAKILSGSVDPTVTATSAPVGSLYLSTSTGKTYRKTDSGSSTNWNPLADSSSTDINPTSFTASNNQSSASNVTGLSFANASVRATTVNLSVTLLATSSLYEYFTLELIQKGSSWEMAQTSAGDNSGYVFTVTTAGQIQYTSPNSAGFVSSTIKFRAKTLPV